MDSSIEKYKKTLDLLIRDGDTLGLAIDFECNPEEFEKLRKKIPKKKYSNFIKNMPSFRQKYQAWYSESLAVVKLILPDRLNDFVKLYEKPKGRKTISCDNYVIEDYLQGLTVTRGGMSKEKIVGPEAAIPQFRQQLNILKSLKRRFESCLFDIKQLVQADLFDSELEAAAELNKKGFFRGAGAVSGVVLESHLTQVCENHKIKIIKKKPTINDLSQLLKDNNIIEIHDWRFIQHLTDLRNLCDHSKKREPKKEEVEDLINGVEKIAKTIF